MTDQEKTDLLDSHAAQLAEYFDSVQIIVTLTEDDAGTALYSMGKGDWYARQGAIREWVRRDEARTNGDALAEKINKDDD